MSGKPSLFTAAVDLKITLTSKEKLSLIGRMKTKLILFSCAALFALTVAGKVLAADTKLEQALRDLDAKWSAAAGAKDVDKTVSYYAADAIVMPPNASRAMTKETIRSAWKEMLTSPGAAITSLRTSIWKMSVSGCLMRMASGSSPAPSTSHLEDSALF